jgi:hypothetical protein
MIPQIERGRARTTPGAFDSRSVLSNATDVVRWPIVESQDEVHCSASRVFFGWEDQWGSLRQRPIHSLSESA